MNDLDKLVEDWGERHSPPPVEDEKKAIAGIVDAIKAAPAVTAGPEAKSARPIMFQLVAAAALVAIGIGIGLMMRGTPHRPDDKVAVGLSNSDIVEIRKVSDEIHRLFPEGLRWISKVNGQITFEPAEKRRISAGEDPRVLIAYTVLRCGDGGKWQSVSRHDIVTWSDEPVEIKSETKSMVWCHVTDDSMAVVEADVQLNVGDQILHLVREELCQFRKPVTVLEQRNGDDRYRVVQTVYRI